MDMKQSSGVGVVVPVFNRARTVLETLNSIAAQTSPPDVLVVIDDGSSDGTYESVIAWRASARNIQRIDVVRTENRGLGAARNLGLERAGDVALVAFLDSDDLWPPDFIARAVQAFAERPDAVAATADRELVWLDGRRRYEPMQELARNATQWIFLNHGGVASTSVFRAGAVRDAGGFPEHVRTGTSFILFESLSLRGAWLYLPGAPVIYQRDQAAEHGEASQLSDQYTDRHRTWALIWEDFIMRGGGASALSRGVYAPAISRRWHWAGRDLMRAGRLEEAQDCFRRSLRWHFHLKACLRLILTIFLRGISILTGRESSRR
jgi:glycosyltransferase involved in cell wall biosynthesis